MVYMFREKKDKIKYVRINKFYYLKIIRKMNK